MYFDRVIDLMISTEVAGPDDFVGISLAKISEVEHRYDIKLPVAYIEFLQHCGRSAGKLSDWTAIYFDDLEEIAEELHFQNTTHQLVNPLPNNSFTFALYQNNFDFFICDGNANPTVYRRIFSDAGAEIIKCSETFIDYMCSLAKKAAENKNSFVPFYVDECGEIWNENLSLQIPIAE